MTNVAFSDPIPGNPFQDEAPKVDTALQVLRAWANGNVDETNLATAILSRLGVSDNSTTRRGAVAISTAETTASGVYTTLTTPDQVTGVALPNNGLLFIAYQATWQESIAGSARAAIFLGSNQLKIANDDVAAPAVQETGLNAGGATAVAKPLRTCDSGLISRPGTSVPYTGDVTTGQVIGGLAPTDGVPTALGGYSGVCAVFAAAGSYNVSVQYKASTGSVTVSNRKLWVWSMGF
jgi:hypothetical protein